MKLKSSLITALISGIFLTTAFSFSSPQALADCTCDATCEGKCENGEGKDACKCTECGCAESGRCQHKDGATCKLHEKEHVNENKKMTKAGKGNKAGKMKTAVEPIVRPYSADKDVPSRQENSKKADEPVAPIEAQPAKK